MSTRLVVSLTLALPLCAMADDATPQALNEVVVTATRTPTPADEVLSSVLVIPEDEISRSLSTDVAELLRMHAGIEISRPGGIGQPVSIFIRGANSTHTSVLLDGVRINPGTIGTASLQNIPPETIERIEVVKGPRSVLYGSDAIGGVINIITRKNQEPGIAAEAQAGYGSYETYRGSGLVDWRGVNGYAGVNVAWLDSEGFPTRENSAIDSAYDNATVSAHAGAKFDRFELGAKVYQASGTVDYQNSPTLPVSQDYLDRVLRADLVSQVNELWRTQLVLSRMDNDIEQNDPVSFPPGEMDYLETHRHTVDWQNDLNLGAAHRLTAGVMVASENAVALSFGTQFDQDTDIVNAYIQHQLTEGAHALLLALGYTDYSTFGGEYIWNVEYGYSFSTGTQLIGAAGNGFRAPTATDLYGFGGNPNLLPEQSRSYELTVRQRITDQQSMALTAFQNQIDELIAFDPVTFTVGNIARARTRGIEASYAIRGDDWRLHIEAVYQDPINLDTRQQLLRRAKKSASAGYAQTFGMLEVGFDVLYSGERLDSQFPGFVELEDYVLANLHARLNLGKHWSVIAQVDNLFDTEYQVASGFNSAERGGSVAVRWNLR